MRASAITSAIWTGAAPPQIAPITTPQIAPTAAPTNGIKIHPRVCSGRWPFGTIAMITSTMLATACAFAATAIAWRRPPTASTDAHAASRPIPAAVSTEATPANTAVSRRIRIISTCGSVIPNRARSQTPRAMAGTSMTDPANKPLKNPQRGGV